MYACQFQPFSRVNIRHLFVEMNNANLLAFSYLVHLYLVYSSTCNLSTVMHKTVRKCMNIHHVKQPSKHP